MNIRLIRTDELAARDIALVFGNREYAIRLGAAAITRRSDVLPE